MEQYTEFDPTNVYMCMHLLLVNRTNFNTQGEKKFPKKIMVKSFSKLKKNPTGLCMDVSTEVRLGSSLKYLCPVLKIICCLFIVKSAFPLKQPMILTTSPFHGKNG